MNSLNAGNGLKVEMMAVHMSKRVLRTDICHPYTDVSEENNEMYLTTYVLKRKSS